MAAKTLPPISLRCIYGLLGEHIPKHVQDSIVEAVESATEDEKTGKLSKSASNNSNNSGKKRVTVVKDTLHFPGAAYAIVKAIVDEFLNSTAEGRALVTSQDWIQQSTENSDDDENDQDATEQGLSHECCVRFCIFVLCFFFV